MKVAVIIGIGRWAMKPVPFPVLGAVIYLAADSSGYTSGSDLIVDGAYVCQ
jgi:hypothetical protein